MGGTVLLRYLSLTARSGLSRLGPSISLVAVLITILSLVVGSLFWLIGSLSSDGGFLSAGLFGLALIGVWGGLSYVSAYRPNGWSWLRKSDWLWLKALPIMLFGLLSAAVTIGSFYLSRYQTGPLFESVEVKIVILLLTLAAIFFGLAVSVGTRRATRNPYLRLLLIVLATYVIGSIIFSTDIVSGLNQAILSRSGDTLLILLLTSLGIFATSLLVLQLMFDSTRLADQKRATFWDASASTRTLALVHRPVIAYILARLALYVRSSSIGRRIALYFLLVITHQILGGHIALSFHTMLAIQLGLVWFLAYSVGSISGQAVAEEDNWLSSMPLGFSPLAASYAAMTLLLLGCLAISWIFFPLASPLVLTLSAVSIGITILNSSARAGRSHHFPAVGQSTQDSGVLAGVLVSLVFVAIPIALSGITSPLTVAGLMILWLIGININYKFKGLLT